MFNEIKISDRYDFTDYEREVTLSEIKEIIKSEDSLLVCTITHLVEPKDNSKTLILFDWKHLIKDCKFYRLFKDRTYSPYPVNKREYHPDLIHSDWNTLERLLLSNDTHRRIIGWIDREVVYASRSFFCDELKFIDLYLERINYQKERSADSKTEEFLTFNDIIN